MSVILDDRTPPDPKDIDWGEPAATFKRHWCLEGGKCSHCGLSAHRGNYFTNGGVVCDNPDGPCACGAWHHDGYHHQQEELCT